MRNIDDTNLPFEIERVIPSKKYFSTKELSKILGRSVSWIYIQIQKSNLRAKKIDGQLRFKREDILKYILDNLSQFQSSLQKHINIKDVFSEFTRYPSIFSLDEFIEYNYNYSDSIFYHKDLYKELLNIIEKDERFLCLTEDKSEKPYFVSKEILIEWLIDLNFRLVKIGLRKINNKQLESFIKLKSGNNVSELKFEKVVDYGSIFGLINYSPIEDEYVFPLHSILFRIPRNILSRVYINLKFFTNIKSQNKYLSRYLSSITTYVISKIKSDRLTELIKNRFGILGSPELTLDKIGKMYGLSRERIRQLEKRHLKKLKYIE